MAKKKTSAKKENEQVEDTVDKEEVKDQEEVIENEVSDKEGEEAEDEQPEEETIESQLNEYKDRYIRLSAEFDNYRKRTLKEKMDLTKTASEGILKKLLPVFDDFERGLIHMDSAKDVEAVKEGVLLIYNKLGDLLKQQGIKEIDAMEKDFDMDIHEAITKIPAPKEELKGKVVDVVEKGYYLNDKIIRYSKVVVGE